MEKAELFGYQAFVNANLERQVTGFDYLRAIYKTAALPTDFVCWLARLFLPTFVVVEGQIFVSELFDKKAYQRLLQAGQSRSSAQFWTNLLEVTGLFDELSVDEALRFADALSHSWNGKLETEFGANTEKARVIHDQGTDEVFVVIGTPE